MTPATELLHIAGGAPVEARPGGAGTIDVLVHAPGAAEAVLDRIKDVLRIVLGHSWPSNDTDRWRSSLPDWLIERFRPEQTQEEAEKWLKWWRQLPREEQARAVDERGWSLSEWLFWFAPEQRDWHWWDATVLNDDSLRVTLEVQGDPTPMGALEWLLIAAGGRDVQRDL